MDSEVPGAPITGNNSSEAEPSFTGSPPTKKSRGKVPRRVHKAEREKLKREHLNELFLELAYALELTEQNNGKASILCETTRVLKDILAQIECLKRENATLLSESQYVAVEKNELEDENSALQIQIRDLKSTLKERMLQQNLDLNVTPADTQEPQVTSYFPEGCLKFPVADPSLRQAPILNPVFVIPVCSDPKVHPDPEPAMLATKPISNVSRPHPRYPTPSDSWPFQILEQQSEAGKELQYSGREQVFGNV